LVTFTNVLIIFAQNWRTKKTPIGNALLTSFLFLLFVARPIFAREIWPALPAEGAFFAPNAPK